MQVPSEILEAMDDVFLCAPHVDQWIVLKRAILNSIRPELRKLFSTRHPVSKRTWTNDMELELARRWSELTGRPIIFKDDEGPTRSEAAP